MKYRTLPNTVVKPISEIGFGLWTLTTGWWGDYTDEEERRMLRKAFDCGINFFDAADSYGNGRSEELLASTFGGRRDDIVIATKVGYDFSAEPEVRRGERELPQKFSRAFVRNAIERSLARLKTDRIDVLQLHNIRMSEVENDALWDLLREIQMEGKILAWGAAFGPAIGWLCEGVDFAAGRAPNGRTLGQAALQWLLRDQRIASCLPNIYDESQLLEFSHTPDCPPLSNEEVERIEKLSERNFGVAPTEPLRFKGTMERLAVSPSTSRA